MVDLGSFPAIYERIKQVIGASTQREVADRLGISQQLLSDLLSTAKGRASEKGPKNLPYKVLVDWALAERVSLEWLLTGKSPDVDPSSQQATPAAENVASQLTVDDAEEDSLARIRQEAELLGAETSAWLLRQAVTNTKRWPDLVAGLWEFRNQWETGGKPPMIREPPDQDEVGLAGDKASGGKG